MKKLIVFGILFALCVIGTAFGLEQFGVRLAVVEVDRSLRDVPIAVAVDEEDAFLIEPANASNVAVGVLDEPYRDPEQPIAEEPALAASGVFGGPDTEPPTGQWQTIPDSSSPIEVAQNPFGSTNEPPSGDLDPVSQDFALSGPPDEATTIPDSDFAVENSEPVSNDALDPFAGDDFVTEAEPVGQLDPFAGADDELDSFHMDRLRLLAQRIQESLDQLGDRHPDVLNARRGLESAIRRNIQFQRQRQREEILRLRDRLSDLENRLNERAEREDELVEALLLSLLSGLDRNTRQPHSPFGPSETEPEPAISATRSDSDDLPDDNATRSESPDDSAPALATNDFGEALHLLEQVTVRVNWQSETQPGFLNHGHFDGVLLADRGIIVSSLPEELTTATDSLELTIVFPATRTMTKSRLVSIDEQTGLAVLEPDLFPDETPVIELTLDEIATGELIFVGVVQDGQFNPENVEVVTPAGRARRLVGRSRTVNRLATDIESRPGNGGAPLLTEDGRLGGIMSARDPGQYIVSGRLSQLLGDLESGGQPAPQAETTAVNRPQPATQNFMSNLSTRSSDLQTNPQALVETILQLHRELSESSLSLKQAEAELKRLQPLTKRGLVPQGETLKAQLARERAITKLELIRQQISVWQQHSALSDRYAQASVRVARAELENAVAANKKVPGSVPDTELRRMMLGAEQRELELQLVQQALELLKEAEEKLTPNAAVDQNGSETGDQDATDVGFESAIDPLDAASAEEGAFEEATGTELPGGIETIEPEGASSGSEDDRTVDPFGSIRESDPDLDPPSDDLQPGTERAPSN